MYCYAFPCNNDLLMQNNLSHPYSIYLKTFFPHLSVVYSSERASLEVKT